MTAVLVDDGGARHLAAGLRLPDVALASTLGGRVRLTHVAGAAVVYVYPWTGRPGFPNPPDWDNIPGAHGSTPEAEGFRLSHTAFAAAGIQVFGVSGQTGGEQAEFAQRLLLPFALLSDAGFAFADALSLPRFETGGVRYLKRLTLLARDGVITSVLYPVRDPAGHAADVLAACRGVQA